MLEHGQDRPIVVVCAPAGYGKSTQISHWVDQQGLPCAWISLDKSHDELGAFLSQLEEAVSGWSSSAAEYLKMITTSSEPPLANYIADGVANRMDDASDEFILVFDDYQNISDASIHLFVESLLKLMPDSLRIALVSRRTPPIALSRLRSRNLVLDVRLEDLQFDSSEVYALVKTVTGVEIDDSLLKKLTEITEGWPAGLRMLLLALAGHKDMREYLMRFEGQVWQIQEYLVEEVLRQLPANTAKYVAATAIAERFSARLCETLVTSTDDDGLSGRQLIELIRNKGLFCIPLDDHGEWFRYHQIFRDLLLHQLRSQNSEAKIQQLHIRAGEWFDNQGDIEEAMQHFLQSGNSELAADTVLRHKSNLIARHEWRRMDRLISMLPTEVVEANAQLVMLLAWVSIRMGRLTRVFELAQIAEELVDSEELSGTPGTVTIAQYNALRGPLKYFAAEGQAALACAEKTLELLPLRHTFERGEATMIRGLSLQMLGDSAAGRKVLFEALETPGSEEEFFRARILAGLCYLSWSNGDLRQQLHFAKTLLDLGQTQHDAHAVVHACWFGGAAHYQLNQLDDAADFVRQAAAQKWWPHQRSYNNCVQILSQIHAVRGEYAKAHELSESLIVHSIEARSTYHLPEVQALQACLALANENHVAANKWAIEFDPEAPTAAYGYSVPALIAARILLESKLPGVQERAIGILDEHQSFYEKTNNSRFLIETLALQAVRYSRAGDEHTADQLLGRAVTLAEPGGFIRVFVDLGPDLVPLLNRLDLSDHQLRYVGTILAGFQGEGEKQQSDRIPGDASHEGNGLVESLSKRETEVLALLAKRLTNKEIGERLFIAPETVKRHAHNIFEKLNVNDRRAARVKAIGLGLVSG